MSSIFPLLKYVIIETFGFVIAFVALGIIAVIFLKRLRIGRKVLLISSVFIGLAVAFFSVRSIPTTFGYPFFLSTYGPADAPVLPFKSVVKFFNQAGRFERVPEIARDPNDIPPPIERNYPETVKITITAKEVISEIAPGVMMGYWTFDGTVPGPFMRVREGDTVELTLKNDPTSLNMHNIDLHAVTGPGGGALVTNVDPGESKTLTFKALNPGLYVYHCAHPNVATHMAHGMYGLILVEPKEGLPKVSKEFYVMQGEFYPSGELGRKGLQIFDGNKMIHSNPEYIVFNGRVKGLVGNMEAKTGERVRMYLGNGGVNLVSSFHVIGEIFDSVFPEGSMGGAILRNVQSTIIPAGGSAIVDFGLEVPGNYVLVDHALARIDRGAWGILEVKGEQNKEIFDGIIDDNSHSH
jgi:nitrite reductase (NO-forming)